jgi:hypothetical protein
MDPRLREAVEASLRWYDDVCALHGIPVRVEDGLWCALGPPPPWHSAAKTLRPGIGSARVVRSTAGFEHCAVADSFGDVDLTPYGFEVLIAATWLHRTPVEAASGALPDGWSVVGDRVNLGAWAEGADYVGVLPPSVLADRRFRVLACHRHGRLVGGAIAHDGGGAVGLSTTWGAGRVSESGDVLRAASVLHPGRAVTGYADGAERAAMLAAGFTALGPQRVWHR